MPTTLEALEILVLFFVPGFVATQVYVRNDPTADASQPKYLLSVAVWSAIVHVLVFPATAEILAVRDQLIQHTDLVVRWFLVYLLAVPALLGLVIGSSSGHAWSVGFSAEWECRSMISRQHGTTRFDPAVPARMSR